MTASPAEPIEFTQEDFDFLADDLPTYAEVALVVRPKDGDPRPLILNASQRFVHDRIEEQRRKTGRVRAIVCKGRQQGVSTYVGARFYWRVTHRRGARAFILTHEIPATYNLFGMTKRYHENCLPELRPETGASNSNELTFPKLDSGYKVATAGGIPVGRSETLQYVHGCLSRDTFAIDGDTGALKRMDEMRLGDNVRTHTCAVAPISAISTQRKTAYVVTLKGLGQMPLTATAEHRFLTQSGWKELKDIEIGETLLFPVSPISDEVREWPFLLKTGERPQGGGSKLSGPQTVRPSYELGRILGLYLAEGTVIKQHSSGAPSAVTFSVHEREAARTEQWLDALGDLFTSIRVARRPDSKTVHVTVYGKCFAAFVLAMCGELAGKKMPSDWARSGTEFARGLVHGYLAGDGCSSTQKHDRRITAPSIRAAITIGMRDALASLGYGWASIGYHPGRLRYGKPCKPAWYLRVTGVGVDRLCEELGWSMPPRERSNASSVKVADGYARVPVIDIEEAGEIEVVDFEVDHPDHSYCTVHAASHNSEVAYWPNAANNLQGLLEAVPPGDDTEVILESTAKEPGDAFHALWKAAKAGESQFIAIFVPWFVHDEYRTPAPADWTPPPAFMDYEKANSLNREQTYWAYLKNRDIAAARALPTDKPCLAFKREYPASDIEAFEAAGDDLLRVIPLEWIRMAQARWNASMERAKRPMTGLGVDVAQGGGDRTALALWHGTRLERVETVPGEITTDGPAVAAAVVRFLRDDAAVAIDLGGGWGGGALSHLKQFGKDFETRVFGVNPSNKSEMLAKKGGFSMRNMRAALHWAFREALDPESGEEIELPPDDELVEELAAATWENTPSGVLIEDKGAIIKRLRRSPDKSDAVLLGWWAARKHARLKQRAARSEEGGAGGGAGSWMS
jgi:hypothetical protein